MPIVTQKIMPCLWFDTEAEAAANLYTSVFRDSKILSVSRYCKEGFEVHGRPEGTVMTVEFQIEGQRFVALNGGPQFKFSEAISFQIHCETQEETDYYHEKLSAGGQVLPCGWLKDKFGMAWQATPVELIKMVTDPDRAKAQRAMQVMMTQEKIDLTPIRKAFEGK